MTIAERIRITRTQKGLSQKELAELSGVNLKSLSRYELGTSVPPADAIKSIADVLKVSTDAILSDDNGTINDKELFEKFVIVQQMSGKDRQVIDSFLDMAIRDYKAKQAYS